MSFTTNTILRVVNRQTYFGTTVNNIYHFVGPDELAPNDLPALAADFVTKYVTPIAATQSDQLNHTNVLIEMVNNGDQFIDSVINVQGSIALVESAPSFIAASFKLVRNVRGIRSGGKRVCGLGEEDFTVDDLSPNGLIKFQALLGTFVQSITDGSKTYVPIIKGKAESGVPNSYNIGLVVDDELSPLVRTQGTRKKKS